MKVKPNLPQPNPTNNTPGNKGVGTNNANQTPTIPRGRAVGHQNNLHEGNNRQNQLNLKVHIGGSVNSNNGLQLGKTLNLQFSANTNVSLNANNKGFALGLNQNLQTAVVLLFNASHPATQNALKGFTNQQVVTTLFLNAGIFAEAQGNVGLHNKGQNPILDNAILRQVFTILSNNNPAQNLPNTIFNQVQSLWNNTHGIFSDCGCTTTVKDLQIIAKTYANALEKGDIKTIVLLTEILQKAQDRTQKGNEKIYNLLTQLISKGEKVAVKNAQLANLNFLKNPQNTAPKNIQLNADKSTAAKHLVGADKQLAVSEKNIQGKSEFYSEKTENALRKQLDFYPHYAYDQQISKFENSSEVSLGEKEFVNKYYSEIEDWLKSGKHRLVKDFEFDKPLGMVVERGESGFITADKLRVVLVRDGSVEGWHFLRSFLIS